MNMWSDDRWEWAEVNKNFWDELRSYRLGGAEWVTMVVVHLSFYWGA
jgi:hypothetical protein